MRARLSPSVLSVILAVGSLIGPALVAAQDGPEMTVSDLTVAPVVSGLVTPTSMAFIGDDDLLVLEKNTGKVVRVTGGAIAGTALDLGVNFASERGLLGIALHPDFPVNPGVYLFWSCPGTPPPAEDPFFPIEEECADQPTLGADTDNTLASPLLGNRVDRFEWDSAAGTLSFDHNLVKLLAFQNDGAPEPPNQNDEQQIARANHDGGVIDFGPDGKLYVLFGDVRVPPRRTTSSAGRSPMTLTSQGSCCA
jgi:glucose/arabinose dehydrogenase